MFAPRNYQKIYVALFLCAKSYILVVTDVFASLFFVVFTFAYFFVFDINPVHGCYTQINVRV